MPEGELEGTQSDLLSASHGYDRWSSRVPGHEFCSLSVVVRNNCVQSEIYRREGIVMIVLVLANAQR